MSKPIERKYNIYKNRRRKDNDDEVNIVIKTPINPIMLSKEAIFNKIKNFIFNIRS